MADTTTTNLLLTKPEVGASTDSWGTKVNSDLDLIDSLFDAGPLLKVTKGGTGVGTSTGSGNNVLSTSPTLVTPVLGAAAATSVTVAAGAVGTPSITTTGDTNTGLFFPAADTIAFVKGGVEAMRISSTGGLSVGTTSDSGAGGIYATGNITAYFSDDRFKTNLGNIPDALAKVQTLNGFYYEANELAQSYGYEKKLEVGVSAQQVQAVQPEVVAPAPINENYLTVRYERLVPLLIEAIKELNAKVDALEKTIAEK